MTSRKSRLFLITLIIVTVITGTGAFSEWIVKREIKTETVIVQEEELPVVVPQVDEPDQELAAESPEIAEEENAVGKYVGYLAEEELMRKENAYPLQTASSETITITFAGDFLLDDEYAIMASMKNRSGQNRQEYIEKAIDAPILKEMQEADLCVINNEFPYTDRGEPTPDKMFTFRADTKEADLLFDMGVDLVSLANNHASDYGEISLLDSLDTLERLGIPCVGAGRNLEDASRPVYYVTDNMKIAVLSATQIERMDNPSTKGATETSPGVFRCRNVENLLKQVTLAKENSDFVIVFIHWGTESTDVLDVHQLDQAPRLVEAGADLIIGHHPHVLQGIDWIDGTPVVYSIGNFLFNSKTMDSCLVTAKLNTETGTLETLRFLPAIQTGCRSVYPDDAERERILTYMRTLSPNVVIDSEGYILFEK